jgi:hypothetical protein
MTRAGLPKMPAQKLIDSLVRITKCFSRERTPRQEDHMGNVKSQFTSAVQFEHFFAPTAKWWL